MKLIKYIYFPFRDLFLHIFPVYLRKEKYSYGFLIHPRDEQDIVTKYPLFSKVPKSVIRFFARWYWPIVVTKVTGLKETDTNETIDGYIISIPLITTQILENRTLAIKRIRQAIELAKKMGVKIIGLGALTASVTKGGEDLTDIPNIFITTGHAYTGFNVTRNLFKLEEELCIDYKKDVVAIVGAAGSIGGISAELIARRGYHNILLIDVERKRDRVEKVLKGLQEKYPRATFATHYNIAAIRDADFIIAATNAPEALITTELLKPGAVVIDDAQPSDVDYAVLESDDVMAIEAGVVHTPGICSNFNLGLKNKFDNFCCMVEVLILASQKWESHFVIKRTTLEFVDKIAEWGKPLNFDVAQLQNRKELISHEKMQRIIQIRKNRIKSEENES
ncbi:MAG: hypothetical protein ACJKTH_02875 [Patescibacteria group bacterium UBA2163]